MARKTVAIIGSAGAESEEKEYKVAWEMGKLLARENLTLISGGLGGIMEAACRGAWEEGGEKARIVGILPGDNPLHANPYVNIPIPTGIGEARNAIVAGSYAVIAIGGGSGTLSEMALAWKKGKLLLAWRGGGFSSYFADKNLDNMEEDKSFTRDDRVMGFDEPQEAIQFIKKFLPLD